MPQLDENHDGVQVDLAVGETLELSLLENPTTGYHWQFDPTPPPVLEVISDTFEPPDGALGAGGRRRWTFRAMWPGEGTLYLTYRRSWETTAARRFTAQISVRS